MAQRIIKSARGGKRIPLGEFDKAITILRVHAAPSLEDASWIRTALKIGNFQAAFEEGEVEVIKSEHTSSRTDFLFVLHREEDHEFTSQDYIIHGMQAYVVRSYHYFQVGMTRYTQLNCKPWGKLKEGDITLDEDAPVPPPLVTPNTDNPFWNS